VYDPEAATVIDCVVCPPGVHKYDEPLFADNVTLPPLQKVVGPPAEIVATGVAAALTEVAAETAEQPDALVTRTVYEPDCVALIDCVV
jgi:hypothetical protein